MSETKFVDFEALLQNITVSVEVCKYDCEFSFVYMNEAFTNLTGYSQDELMELQSHLSLVHYEDANTFGSEIQKQIEAQGNFELEYRIVKKGGKVIWINTKGVLVKSKNQEDTIQLLSVDVSKRVAKTEILSQRSYELENITNNINAAIIRCDFDDYFTITFANDGFYRMIGYTKEEFAKDFNNSLMLLIYTQDIEFLQHNLNKQVDSSTNTVNLYRLVKKDKKIIWVLSKGSLLTMPNGKISFNGVLTDITEQKEVEEALRISEKKYEIAMYFADMVIFEYNIETKSMLLQEEEAEKYGLDKKLDNAVEFLLDSGLIHENSVEDFSILFSKIEKGDAYASATVHVINKAGQEGVFEFNLTNIFDNDGNATVAIGVKKDISESFNLEREKEYSNSMTLDQVLIYEANISTDKILSYNTEWAKEIGLPQTAVFSELMKYIELNLVYPEDRELFATKFSSEAILNAFDSGQKIIHLEYRKKTTQNEYRWFRKNVNIIKDRYTGNISVRCYLVEINEIKEKELKVADELKYFETMISRSIAAYTINVTKDIFLSGEEKLTVPLSLVDENCYSKLINEFLERIIYSDDKALFIENFSREHMLNSFAKNNLELSAEYRRPYDNEFIWVRTTAHLYEDPQCGDIKALMYVENINETKLKALAMIYKSEHDMLTGFYNKVSTENYITDFLSTSEGMFGKHAFFIFDVDHFKSINDNFGHAFGDVVLSQISKKINDLFRDIDILGRIGGDEFVVFMKNIQSKNVALAKAREMRERIFDSYTQNGKSYHISLSIGLAFYSEHGTSYSELYKNSDTALYISKENGRDQYNVYSDSMVTMESAKADILVKEFTEAKSFSENITEYVFRILFESQDKISAINSVLELIGKHYNVSRAYIFEVGHNGQYIRNTFEWCKAGITPQIQNLQRLEGWSDYKYKEFFNQEGVFFINNVTKLPKEERDMLEQQGIKSMLQFIMTKNGSFKGLVGFDECEFYRVASSEEIAVLKNISNIVGLFVMEMRSIEESESSKKVVLSIINALSSYAYVCDPADYKILFVNSKIVELVPNVKIGGLCYEEFWARSKPCDECPMRYMLKSGEASHTMDMFNNNINMWVKATASWVSWIDGEKACLVDSVDTTKYIGNKPDKPDKRDA